jgi:hypothetical protein
MTPSEQHEEAREKRERLLDGLLRGGERVRKGRKRPSTHDDET